jgi:hypothetical protein
MDSQHDLVDRLSGRVLHLCKELRVKITIAHRRSRRSTELDSVKTPLFTDDPWSRSQLALTGQTAFAEPPHLETRLGDLALVEIEQLLDSRD